MKCVVCKLGGVVQVDTLEKLGTCNVKIQDFNTLNIMGSEDIKLEWGSELIGKTGYIQGEGELITSPYIVKKGVSYPGVWLNFTGTGILHVSDKYKLLVVSDTFAGKNISNAKSFVSSQYLLYGTSVANDNFGSIEDISSLINLVSIEVHGSEITGELTNLAKGMIKNGRRDGSVIVKCSKYITLNQEIVGNNISKTITFNGTDFNIP